MSSQDRPALSLVMVVTVFPPVWEYCTSQGGSWSEDGLSEGHNWPIPHPGPCHPRMSITILSTHSYPLLTSSLQKAL